MYINNRMMFIYAQSTATQFIRNLPECNLTGILLRKSGVSTAAKTIADITDRIVITANGEQRVNVLLRNMLYINKIEYGMTEENDGIDFSYSVFLPIDLLVTENTNATIEMQSLLSAETSNNIEIVGIQADENSASVNAFILEQSKTHNGQNVMSLDNSYAIYLLPATPASVSQVNIRDTEDKTLISGSYKMLNLSCLIFSQATSSITGTLVNHSSQPQKVLLDMTNTDSVQYYIINIGYKS